MEPDNFRIPSVSGVDELNCYRWMPEGEPIASLQIVHGMTEHILRYSDFAQYLCSKGFAVYGHDHLGHGGTSEEKGFFAERDGWTMLVADVKQVNRRMRDDLPGIKHFIMGHSMGSFVVRNYLKIHSTEVDGAIIMGTGNQSSFKVAIAFAYARILCKLKGNHYVSSGLNSMVLGSYNKKFDIPDLPNRWLCSNPKALEEYRDDPLCGFDFTCAAYRDLFRLIRGVIGFRGPVGIHRELPIMFVSGEEDPVGDFGKGVLKAAKNMENNNLSPTVKLYPGMRHEILNEVGHEQVYRDISDWLTGLL